MKSSALLLLVVIAVSAAAQEKPRVFIQGKGSENVSSNGSGGGGHHWGAWGSKSTIDSHDESMEVTKDFQRDCAGVIVSINQTNADYIVMMNRESKQNRGLLRTNNQIQVANRAGDILGSKATRTVGNAAKDACTLILADWQANGRINAQEAPVVPPQQQPTVTPAVQTTPAAQTMSTGASPVQAQPNLVPAAVTVSVTPSDSVAGAASKAKQHKACLDLAKDNPSITCKKDNPSITCK